MPRSHDRAVRGALLLLAAAAGCSDPASPPASPVTNATVAPVVAAKGTPGARRHVIVLKDGVTADLSAAVTKAGGRIRRSDGSIGVVTVEGLSDAAVASLGKMAEVEAVAPDVTVQWIPPRSSQHIQARHFPQASANQSSAAFFPFQWNLQVIQADKAWDVSRQGAGALVCVLDTGVDPDHLDLRGKVDLAKSTTFVESEDGILDRNLHGTFVSGLVSTRGIGIASTAPRATLCMVKVLDQTGRGSFADIISGIIYATDAGADVINMSLGAYFSRKDDGAKELIRALQRAIDYASKKGVVVVAAAGNEGVNLNSDPSSFISAPAELNHVISVGATAPTNQQDFDQIASYSNFGARGVDIYAPGGDFVDGGSENDLVISACSGGNTIFDCTDEQSYLEGAGTSFAAPLVSAEAAVIESQLPGPPGRRAGDTLHPQERGSSDRQAVRPDLCLRTDQRARGYLLLPWRPHSITIALRALAAVALSHDRHNGSARSRTRRQLRSWLVQASRRPHCIGVRARRGLHRDSIRSADQGHRWHPAVLGRCALSPVRGDFHLGRDLRHRTLVQYRVQVRLPSSPYRGLGRRPWGHILRDGRGADY